MTEKVFNCGRESFLLVGKVSVRDRPTRGSEQSGCWKLPRVGWDFSDFWGFTWVFFTFETHSTPTRSVGFSAISLEKWDFLPKTTFFFGFHLLLYPLGLDWSLHKVPNNTVNPTQLVLSHFRYKKLWNWRLNYPLGQKPSGISIFGTTRFPQWEVGLFRKIEWEVPTHSGGTPAWVYLYMWLIKHICFDKSACYSVIRF